MSEETGPLAQQAAVAPGVTAVAAPPPVGQGHGADHSHGMSDWGYAKIAILLAVVTAAEVAWSYLPVWDNATGGKHLVEVGGLLAMMAFKFFYVAANFMHLKFDDKILTRLFYAGLFLAVIVYSIALTTFHVFW
ncbi:MAG: hypothetical protein JWM89_4123 [Acidimicrobiales bacterium]|nr:hypothetical protein [Acidimicrobiales bacterium]